MKIFHPAVREWFTNAFPSPTRPQQSGWPAIASGASTLILAPTGSGKTLAAFLWCLNRLMFTPAPPKASRCRVLYISPLKALAVDVERNLRAPLAGIANVARAHGADVTMPDIAIRTGDTPALERSRFLRNSADILITTPESLFLLLTSNARERLVTVDTLIIDEIHALVPGKRGAHLALSLERLEALRERHAKAVPHDTDAGAAFRRPIQRIGLSATQRPLDEVARFLGGAQARSVRRTKPVKATPSRKKALRPVEARERDIESDLHQEFADPPSPRGSGWARDRSPATFRPVTVIDASEKKALELRIEVPVEDMARLAAPIDPAAAVPPASRGAARCGRRSGRRCIRACSS